VSDRFAPDIQNDDGDDWQAEFEKPALLDLRK